MIAFSGIDCCGKSTQIQLLCRELQEQGRKYQVVWSRGGYTPGIEFVKKCLRGGKSGINREAQAAQSARVNENPRKRRLLFLAGLIDLWWYYSVVLRLKEVFGTLVICDRYIWDTYIDYKMKYPDYDFEQGFWWKLTLRTMLKPCPSVVMYIPAEESMRRSSLKDEPFPEPIEVRRRRIALYMEQMEKGRWDYKINAEAGIEEVYASLREKLPL